MSRSIIADNIKNILVIRPDAIGDMVLTLPAVRALKEHFPGASLTVLARESLRPLLQNDPDIDQVITDYDFKPRHFDLSVNFFNQTKDTVATRLADIPYRLGDSARPLTGWLNNLRVFRRWNDCTRHEVELNLDLLVPLGITAPASKAKLTAAPADRARIETLLCSGGIQAGEQLIGVHIGAGGNNNKSWNTVSYAEVINWLSQKPGVRVILTGGADAKERAAKIVLLCLKPPLNLVGENSLSELIALLAKFDFYFGPDTGPTHLAAALGIPLVTLFLSKRAKPLRWGPWGTRHLVVRNFSRCEKLCYPPACREKIVCTEEVEPKTVIAACETVLSGGGVVKKEETFRHWCQQSFSLAFYHDEKSRGLADKLVELLTASGYHAYQISGRDRKGLTKLFTAEDTSVIHNLTGRNNLTLWLAWQLTGTYQSNRALLVNSRVDTNPSAEGLISLYVARFRRSVW